jgi:hypothetical protein
MKVTENHPIDWDNLDEVREHYKKNGERTGRIFAIININFIFSMVTALVPAIILTAFTVFGGAGKLYGMYFIKFVYGNEAAKEGVRDVINSFSLEYLLAIWVIGVTALITRIFDMEKPHKYLRVIYILVSAVAFISVIIGAAPVGGGMFCFVYGIVGFIFEDLVIRAFPELEELSKEPGFPRFMDYFDSAHAINNTNSFYVDYKKKLEQKHENDKKEGIKIQKAITKENFTPEKIELGVMPDLIPPEIDTLFEDQSETQKESIIDKNIDLFD